MAKKSVDLRNRLLKSGVSLVIGLLALSVVNGQVYADVVSGSSDAELIRVIYYLLVIFCVGSGILFLSAISTAIMAVASNSDSK